MQLITRNSVYLNKTASEILVAMRTFLFVAMVLLSSVWATKPEVVGPIQHRISVLDLVDLGDNQAKIEFGEVVRKSLDPKLWLVTSHDSAAKKLREFGQNPDQPCNNPQCSFDAGNILQTEYVLYGTCTPFGRVDAVTLKLLHIPTAQVVWEKVAEVPSPVASQRALYFEKSLSASLAELIPSKFNLEKPRAKKSLAIIDLSDNPNLSKVFFERISTRIYGNRHYDLMSPSELAELLQALEINKYSVVPSVENMVGLGQKLGMNHLLYSRLYRDGKSYVYRLAFYDVAAKKLILELPPQPSEDYVKLLDYERVFFNTLASKQEDEPKTVAQVQPSKSKKALWVSLGLLGIGGGLAALWVESLKKDDKGSGSGTAQVDFGEPMAPPPDESL